MQISDMVTNPDNYSFTGTDPVPGNEPVEISTTTFLVMILLVVVCLIVVLLAVDMATRRY